MPSARVRTITAVNSGLRTKERIAYLKSRSTSPTMTAPQVGWKTMTDRTAAFVIGCAFLQERGGIETKLKPDIISGVARPQGQLGAAPGGSGESQAPIPD